MHYLQQNSNVGYRSIYIRRRKQNMNVSHCIAIKYETKFPLRGEIRRKRRGGGGGRRELIKGNKNITYNYQLAVVAVKHWSVSWIRMNHFNWGVLIHTQKSNWFRWRVLCEMLCRTSLLWQNSMPLNKEQYTKISDWLFFVIKFNEIFYCNRMQSFYRYRLATLSCYIVCPIRTFKISL